MATLVLTAAGGLIAGPFGAALGAIAGQRIDASLFAPKARQGPRLGDLSVQTSSYGTAIPKLFGTMRIAGTVIWATDLKEEKNRSGGGKGRPATESYSYSASFAVALSGRPIRAVRRIWADGKLLRGAAGDFKSRTDFRFYLGSEEQPVDPLIASSEGIGKAPAHRGIAYAVFEDFQLADYGNRIPSLTFEVEADAEPVALGAIAEQLSGGIVRGGDTPALAGYAASGESVRSAIQGTCEFLGLTLVDGDEELLLTEPNSTVIEVARAEADARGESGVGGRTEVARKAAMSIPSEVSVAYYDPSRDYQSGLQRARRNCRTRSEAGAMPAVLTADAAKQLAERRLGQLAAAGQTATLHLPHRFSAVSLGSLVSVPGQGGAWKVVRRSLTRMVVSLELVRTPGGGITLSEASAGRPTSESDLLHGPTTLFLFEIPGLEEELPVRPRLVAMAAGISAGWRRAALLASLDGGASWTEAGATAAPATLGHALQPIPAGDAALFDDRTTVDVELLNDGMWLESRSDDALLGGANLAIIGRELIQFGRAAPIGPRRFRLSRLLRGRRGTEWAASDHMAGDAFAMLESSAMAVLERQGAAPGAEIRLLAQGIGDPEYPTPAALLVRGDALAPPSPVHLKAEALVDGAILIAWVRRSRIGWHWGTEAETPLGEESERYQLVLLGNGFERRIVLSAPGYLYSPEQQLADGFSGTLRIGVTQIGTQASSRASSLNFPTIGD